MRRQLYGSCSINRKTVQLHDAADDLAPATQQPQPPQATVHASDPFKGLRLRETWLDARLASVMRACRLTATFRGNSLMCNHSHTCVCTYPYADTERRYYHLFLINPSLTVARFWGVFTIWLDSWILPYIPYLQEYLFCLWGRLKGAEQSQRSAPVIIEPASCILTDDLWGFKRQ